nr:DUF4422 domain-containing protein [uncultured Agathobaculum sp.]
MEQIKLYVSCHKPFDIPAHPLLFPIQVGAAQAKERFDGMLSDAEGDNISAVNSQYCELTAQYWAWKNDTADWQGCFHYRRFLYPDMQVARPYRIENIPTLPLLQKLGYENFEELIRQYDLICPIGEQMYVPVRQHYAEAPFHHQEDMERMESILYQMYPAYRPAAQAYLDGTVHYFGNLYIFSREQFERYCAWLFPLLAEFDRQTDLTGYSTQERRVDGYLAERLFGIYLTHVRQNETLRVLELPRVHFEGMGGGNYRKKQMMAAVLPPNSRRRAFVKKIVKGGAGA